MAMSICNDMLGKDSPSDDELDCGLTSAFILCRTVGNQEQGPGIEFIENTPVIIDKLYWILEEVLNTKNDIVLGFKWDPANILQDVATLSNSDRMKKLIVHFIPLILRSLKERGRANFRLVKFASHALAQLIFERKSFPLFWVMRDEIKGELLSLMNNAKFKQSEADYTPVRYEIEGLIGSMEAMNPPQESPAIPSVPSDPKPHVMISYQWDNIELATELQVRIEAEGFHTWMDILSMGPNFHDSMSFAIENACAFVCIVSKGYLESLSCRKEAEYADVRRVPFVWVTGVQEPLDEYVVHKSWLGSVLKNVSPINATDLEAGWSKVLEQLNKIDQEDKSDEDDNLANSFAALGLTGKATGKANKDMLSALVSLVTQLKEENEMLKQQVELMVESQGMLMNSLEEIKADVKTLVENM